MSMPALSYPIHTGPRALNALQEWLSEQSYSKVFVLSDHHTEQYCRPLLPAALQSSAAAFSIPPGEGHKTIDTCQVVWDHFTFHGLDRRSLVINLGGGLLGDLGGFCAATYKRGIDFVQVPTTLLAQVDASVGGKTGVNFQHFKNHLGAFADPQAVFADPAFFATLPPRELLSGYAEVLKHCLIADWERWNALSTLPGLPKDWTPVIEASIRVKSAIVALDPLEKGARKALNFGHTIGHGIESAFMDEGGQVTHGEVVAAGMVAESFISRQVGLLSENELLDITRTILRLFPRIPIDADKAGTIADTALQDKKNEAGTILCTLLDGIGHYRINVPITRTDILDALDFYQHHPIP